jgi:DNA-binding transcriptional MerR regulator
MELQTISQISKSFRLSTRTLRYYEQLGLIQSTKAEDYAYRTYDPGTVLRLRQIVVLRKLRIPLKQIAVILGSEESGEIIRMFEQNLRLADEEITALTAIRDILNTFITRLNESAQLNLKPHLLDDVSITALVDSLHLTQLNIKEDKMMQDLNQTNERLTRLTDREVRIVYLPPSPVAALHIMGSMAELEGETAIREFIDSHKLTETKPDFRHYGFNHPDGRLPELADHGYERWITIPGELEVKAPFVKKRFAGGLYAAHMIPMGDFEEWKQLSDWVHHNDLYEPAGGDPECMNGCLEEHLDFIHKYKLSAADTTIQLDLLMPVKLKTGVHA